MAFVIRHGRTSASSLSSGIELVKELSNGGKVKCVYTALRTTPKGRALALETHVERLRNSAGNIGIQAVPTASEVEDLVGRASEALGAGNMGLVVLAVTNDELAAHVKLLPPLPEKPILVDVALAHRSYGNTKDSHWIAERDQLFRSPGSNETLLMNDHGEISEGASSNFFVIRNDRLRTCDEGILNGSIRKIVLEIAQKSSIQVDLLPPDWNERNEWQDAFLTSTSRQVLPIDKLQDGQGNVRCFGDHRHPIISVLQEKMDEKLAFS